MRIAFDLLLAEKEPGGMLFAARALLEGLAQVDRVNEYIIISSQPGEYQGLAARAKMRVQPVRPRFRHGVLIQHQLLLSEILGRLQPDVLHVPAFAAPIGWNGPLVLTVHDLAFLKMPEQASLYSRIYWQGMLKESARRARAIITASTQTRDELITYWALERERIHLVPHALRASLGLERISIAERRIVRQPYGGRYLLHAGRIMPRKNVGVLVRAFELLAPRFPDLQLVLTGGAGYGSAEVLGEIEHSPYRRRIHQTGWLADRDLGRLYAGASMLVFPSKLEGFGLPALEAMACGTPVVASPEAVVRELAGGAVMYADCTDAGRLAEVIARLLENTDLQQRLSHLGRKQARNFTCTRCAEKTLQVYELVGTRATMEQTSVRPGD